MINQIIKSVSLYLSFHFISVNVAKNNCCTWCLNAARQSSTESSACACAAETVRMDMNWLITLCKHLCLIIIILACVHNITYVLVNILYLFLDIKPA